MRKARMLAREMDHLLANDSLFPTADDAAIAAWASLMMRDRTWPRSIVGSLVADLLRLAQETGR